MLICVFLTSHGHVPEKSDKIIIKTFLALNARLIRFAENLQIDHRRMLRGGISGPFFS